MYVGVLVFGLITALVTVPYTVMMATGYRPPPEAPYELLFPATGVEPGDGLFLLLACVWSIALTVTAWRGLIRGARADARRRIAKERLKRQMREYARGRRGPPKDFN